jgi:BirA family biotin operon repressor/biotin-[acetyl-CoA-carboxylase] ligase
MDDTRRAVLDAVADGPTPGPDIADRLGVSRAAVWKHVEALRSEGFAVESTDEGYRLAGVEGFGGPAIEYGLDAPFTVEFHDTVASTNTLARERAEAGRRDHVVVAAEQTGGRGRLDREWTSPRGGLWLSAVLGPECPPAEAPVFTLAAAVALVRALDPLAVDASIKWPNDVLLDTSEGHQKVAGVLTEMAGEHDRVAWVVLGIGCNANVDPETLPPGATSLAEQAGTVDRRALAQRLLDALDSLRGRPDAILDAWREHARTPGRRVRVETPRETVVGVARDVETPGTLLVETDDGRTVRVSTGDCEHLRPAD